MMLFECLEVLREGNKVGRIRLFFLMNYLYYGDVGGDFEVY